MQDAADKGIQANGEDSIAGRRLATMRDFYAHVMSEQRQLVGSLLVRRGAVAQFDWGAEVEVDVRSLRGSRTFGTVCSDSSERTESGRDVR